MPDSIVSAAGAKHGAKVDDTLRLHTRAVQVEEETEANIEGDAYNINTGKITLTDAADTPVLYFKNNEERAVHVTAIAVGFGTSTGGSATEQVEVTVIRNPTAGTIIDNATDADINSNRNYGSSNSLTSLAYKGATGNTMTDGTDHLYIFQNDFGRLFATIDEVLPKGTTLGIKLKPPTGNTSMPCYAALICNIMQNGG